MIDNSQEPLWYACYTKPRAEKKVFERLTAQGIHSYLPLQKTMRQWSDRKKKVEVPLINSYIFVKITKQEYDKVIQTPGLICFIYFAGRAEPIPDDQIQFLKKILSNDITVETLREKLEPGSPVEIDYGGLKGTCGILVKYKGENRVMIELKGIEYALILTVPTVHLKGVPV